MSVMAVSDHKMDRIRAGSGTSSPVMVTLAPAQTPSTHFSVSGSSQAPPPAIEESSSDMGVISRVLAGIDSVGTVPAEVSVYSQPVGHSIMTDVVVHQTDQNDGTKRIGNHWEETSIAPPRMPAISAPADGISAQGRLVGAYEEGRRAAHEAYMMFQGMKLNQTA